MYGRDWGVDEEVSPELSRWLVLEIYWLDSSWQSGRSSSQVPAGKMLQITLWCKVLLEKLAVDSSGQEMYEIYGTSRCIGRHTKAHAQILFWVESLPHTQCPSLWNPFEYQHSEIILWNVLCGGLLKNKQHTVSLPPLHFITLWIQRLTDYKASLPVRDTPSFMDPPHTWWNWRKPLVISVGITGPSANIWIMHLQNIHQKLYCIRQLACCSNLGSECNFHGYLNLGHSACEVQLCTSQHCLLNAQVVFLW